MGILFLIIGFVLLVKGADWFVDGASCIAAKLGIPQLIIGLTIVAMGTSLPETAVSISAALSGNNGIAVGNVVGSNIMNTLLILGVTAVIANVSIKKSTLYYEIPFMVGITGLMAILGISGNGIVFGEGVVLLVFFLIYLAYLFWMARQGSENEPEKRMPIWKCLLLLVIGGVLVAKGSDLAVDGATRIARSLGISERVIGLTIVAFGTSLPELVTSATAARRGNTDIAIGNIVGSNIFNILLVLGVSALICDIPFDPKFLMDIGVAIGCGIVLWLGTFWSKELRRPFGILMLFLDALYFLYLCF